MIVFVEAPDSRREHRALDVGSAVMLRRLHGFYSLARVGAALGGDEYLGIVIDSRGPGGIDPRLSPGDCVRFEHRHAFRLPVHFLQPSLKHRTAAAPSLGVAAGGEPLPSWLVTMLSLIERSSRPVGWAGSSDDFAHGRLRCIVCDSTAVRLDGAGQPYCERCGSDDEHADGAQQSFGRSRVGKRRDLLA